MRHRTSFDSVEQIAEWFHDEKPSDWRNGISAVSDWTTVQPCVVRPAAAHLNWNTTIT